MWNRLTEPSSSLTDGLERRQARVLAAALVFLLPGWAIAVAVSLGTRQNPATNVEILLAAALTALAVFSYIVSRTRFYRLAVVVLIATSVLGPNVAGVVEADRVRATVSMLFGATAALYASVFMNTRATFVSALVSLGCFFLFGARHPALTVSDLTLPMFLMAFILGLTVVAAAVRESQLVTIKGQSAHLAAIFESTNDAVAAVNRGGLVSLWSPRATALFEVEPEDADGKSFAELVANAEGQERVRQALERGMPRFEFVSKLSRSFEASLAPLKGATGGAVVVARDVTERKALEARLMLIDRLETMGRMVAGVAHEINNPLSYVQANLRVLAEEPGSKENADLIAETLDGTRRIQTIVKDLLTFSRSSSEREEVGAVYVEKILESSMHLAKVHATAANATFIPQFSDVGAVMGIDARLGQVFLTLVMNAIQALPPQGGRREIIVSTKAVGNRVIVGVRDFGEGMTPEVRAKLFTPFFTTKPVGRGTGLGLSIAHSIVRALGGEIRVETAKGQGSLFEVVLPTTLEGETAASGE